MKVKQKPLNQALTFGVFTENYERLHVNEKADTVYHSKGELIITNGLISVMIDNFITEFVLDTLRTRGAVNARDEDYIYATDIMSSYFHRIENLMKKHNGRLKGLDENSVNDETIYFTNVPAFPVAFFDSLKEALNQITTNNQPLHPNVHQQK